MWLSRSDRRVSRRRLVRAIEPYTTGPVARAIVDRALSAGRWIAGPKDTVGLTASTRSEVLDQLGKDARVRWNEIVERRLPAIVLGLDPDDADVRARLLRLDTLYGAVIATGFGLPAAMKLSPDRVRSELIWRTMREAMPELLGKGPFPMVSTPGEIGTFVLARIAGSKQNQLPGVMVDLAARAIHGAPKAEWPVRRRLPLLGCARGGGDLGHERFAHAVLAVARRLTTPPFVGRVAIAHVFEAYARQHPETGSLAQFKEKLVAAARLRHLELGALTLSEHLGRDLLEKSQAWWGRDPVHFVVTGGGAT